MLLQQLKDSTNSTHESQFTRREEYPSVRTAVQCPQWCCWKLSQVWKEPRWCHDQDTAFSKCDSHCNIWFWPLLFVFLHLSLTISSVSFKWCTLMMEIKWPRLYWILSLHHKLSPKTALVHLLWPLGGSRTNTTLTFFQLIKLLRQKGLKTKYNTKRQQPQPVHPAAVWGAIQKNPLPLHQTLKQLLSSGCLTP